MKNTKRLFMLTIALIMTLALAACDGDTTPNGGDIPNGGNTPSGSDTNSPNPPATSTPGGNAADNQQATVRTANDGDFSNWFTDGAFYIDDNIVDFGLASFGLAFHGDTTHANPEFTNVKVFINGRQKSTSYDLEVEYTESTGTTQYRFMFPSQPPNSQGHIHPVIMARNAFIVFEVDYNGVTLRSHTFDMRVPFGMMDDESERVIFDVPNPIFNILTGQIYDTGGPFDDILDISGDNDDNVSGTYSITFDANGGEIVGADGGILSFTITPDRGEGFEHPLLLMRTDEGYNWNGWFIDGDLSRPFDFNAPITSDLTIVAMWTKN